MIVSNTRSIFVSGKSSVVSILYHGRRELSSSRFIKEMSTHTPGEAMCAQTIRLRMGHKSSCIVQPILGHYLEYDGDVFRVSFGSALGVG